MDVENETKTEDLLLRCAEGIDVGSLAERRFYAHEARQTRRNSAAGYVRHRPETTLLYQVVEKYWPEFQADEMRCATCDFVQTGVNWFRLIILPGKLRAKNTTPRRFP